ncbi:hypothetical protein CK489_15445 [Bradyrhizobium sp. UFLA03-84]|uniref:XkdW family protein n=1 Tax=Bradyrhizobium sp. UFLA03-84 TaxID=418599 RepID=UPI000BAE49BE|nr:hypothetical protein [Bradyrhizobium sp. UFLA03-84]PAY07193.1 hypothetical protein CK489_15445 [Bradyrhizobium sp. UFLA03-84]
MAFQPEQFVIAVQSLCPGLMPRIDFEVTNDGTGPMISKWNRPDVAQPTPAQIEAVDTDAIKAALQIPDISLRQFYQQLAVQGVITQDDALSAVRTGALPSALQTIVNGLPQAQQFPATMMLSGASTFQRSNSMTAAIGAAYGWTSEQIDAFFVAAAQI